MDRVSSSASEGLYALYLEAFDAGLAGHGSLDLHHLPCVCFGLLEGGAVLVVRVEQVDSTSSASKPIGCPPSTHRLAQSA